MTLTQVTNVLKTLKVGKVKTGKHAPVSPTLTTVRVKNGRMFFMSTADARTIQGSVKLPGWLMDSAFQVDALKLIKAIEKFEEPTSVSTKGIVFPSGKSGEFVLNVTGINVEDDIERNQPQEATVALSEFNQAMSFVRNSVDDKGERTYLNGVSLEFTDKLAVSTDGRRLSVHPLNIEGNIEKPVTVPSGVVDTFAKLGGNLLTVKTGENGGKTLISIDDEIEVMFTHDSTFPNFRQVIPKSYDFKVILDSESVNEIQSQCKTVESMHKANVFPGLSPRIVNKGIEFFAPNLVEDWGEYRFSVIMAESENADMLAGLSINAMFLREALSNLPGQVTLEGKTFNCPIKITSPATEGFHVVMPMKRLN